MDTVTVTGRCFFCGEQSSVEMPYQAWMLYQSGMFIQEAWPEATPAEREILISGSHEKCFDDAFKEDEDD